MQTQLLTSKSSIAIQKRTRFRSFSKSKRVSRTRPLGGGIPESVGRDVTPMCRRGSRTVGGGENLSGVRDTPVVGGTFSRVGDTLWVGGNFFMVRDTPVGGGNFLWGGGYPCALEKSLQGGDTPVGVGGGLLSERWNYPTGPRHFPSGEGSHFQGGGIPPLGGGIPCLGWDTPFLLTGGTTPGPGRAIPLHRVLPLWDWAAPFGWEFPLVGQGIPVLGWGVPLVE